MLAPSKRLSVLLQMRLVLSNQTRSRSAGLIGDALRDHLMAAFDPALADLGCLGLRGLAIWRMLVVPLLHRRQPCGDHPALLFAAWWLSSTSSFFNGQTLNARHNPRNEPAR